MEIYNRTDIRKLIKEIEVKYPVNEWMHNGYHIWPVLRIALYMYLVKKDESGNNKGTAKKLNRFTQIKNLLGSIWDVISLDKSIKNVYLGAPSHSVNYKGQEFNRYFDPMMDANDNSSLYLSRSRSKSGVYKPERHLSYDSLLFGYSIFNKLFNIFPGKSPHIKELSKILRDLQFPEVDISDFERNAGSFLKKIERSYALSMVLLKRIKPKKIFVLCYYSADVIGLIIAAHELGIITIDIQHGGHGKNHLAYSSWKNVPLGGYEALPNFFYTWDEASAQNINSWAHITQKHTAEKFGNPWVEGWQQGRFSDSGYSWPDNLILYTLQPIGEPLQPYLLETILKTKDKWNWWLRLHPRQLGEIDDIKLRLSEYDLLDKVNIEDATRLPLPEILAHSQVHLTKFSGCAIEAHQFGVPTILLDKKGKDIYSKYIDSGDLMSAYIKERTSDLIEELNKQFSYADKKNN